MKIKLEVSNSFQLELESGKTFRIREDGYGRLAITNRGEETVAIFARLDTDTTPTGIGKYHEVILV